MIKLKINGNFFFEGNEDRIIDLKFNNFKMKFGKIVANKATIEFSAIDYQSSFQKKQKVEIYDDSVKKYTGFIKEIKKKIDEDTWVMECQDASMFWEKDKLSNDVIFENTTFTNVMNYLVALCKHPEFNNPLDNFQAAVVNESVNLLMLKKDEEIYKILEELARDTGGSFYYNETGVLIYDTKYNGVFKTSSKILTEDDLSDPEIDELSEEADHVTYEVENYKEKAKQVLFTWEGDTPVGVSNTQWGELGEVSLNEISYEVLNASNGVSFVQTTWDNNFTNNKLKYFKRFQFGFAGVGKAKVRVSGKPYVKEQIRAVYKEASTTYKKKSITSRIIANEDWAKKITKFTFKNLQGRQKLSANIYQNISVGDVFTFSGIDFEVEDVDFEIANEGALKIVAYEYKKDVVDINGVTTEKVTQTQDNTEPQEIATAYKLKMFNTNPIDKPLISSSSPFINGLFIQKKENGNREIFITWDYTEKATSPIDGFLINMTIGDTQKEIMLPKTTRIHSINLPASFLVNFVIKAFRYVDVSINSTGMLSSLGITINVTADTVDYTGTINGTGAGTVVDNANAGKNANDTQTTGQLTFLGDLIKLQVSGSDMVRIGKDARGVGKDGILITGGALEVINPEGTAIIDGKSNMLKIHQTGLVNIAGGQTLKIKFPLLPYRPMFLIFLNIGQSSRLGTLDGYFGSGASTNFFEYGAVGRIMADTDGDALFVNLGQSYTAAFNAVIRYVIFKEEGI